MTYVTTVTHLVKHVLTKTHVPLVMMDSIFKILYFVLHVLMVVKLAQVQDAQNASRDII